MSLDHLQSHYLLTELARVMGVSQLGAPLDIRTWTENVSKNRRQIGH